MADEWSEYSNTVVQRGRDGLSREMHGAQGLTLIRRRALAMELTVEQVAALVVDRSIRFSDHE